MPGKRLGAALATVLVLFPAVLAGCGGGEKEAAAEPPAVQPPAASEGDAAAGEAVWTQAGCYTCHTLAAAGATGAIAPNLDELKPGFDQTVEQVTNGGGKTGGLAMPAFKDVLTEQQIRDVAAYVVQSTSG